VDCWLSDGWKTLFEMYLDILKNVERNPSKCATCAGCQKGCIGAQQQNAHLLKDMPSMCSILCFSLRYPRSGTADILTCATIFYKMIWLLVGLQNVFDPIL
jgi:hypothetical protein